MAAVLRLLALISVLLMPFGMSAAPASPATGHHAASMPMDHCDGEPAQSEDRGGIADCAMPCSAALPAADLQPAALERIVRNSTEPLVERMLAGVLMEIATPPPRAS
jgi:hypothetical protein